MDWLRRYLRSSVGKKQVVAVTGLGLVLFLIGHLAGNLQIFRPFGGAQGFNEYAHHLQSMAIIWGVRAGLLAIFAVHIGLALKLTLENRDARPVPYVVVNSRGAPSRRSFASQTMIYSGALVLVFVILHVRMFTLGPGMGDHARYAVAYPGEPAIRNLHILVIERFHEPAVVGWYVLCMAVLGLHLNHAIASVFETFGLDHPRWTPLVLKGGKALAWAIAAGFASIPFLVLTNVGV